MYDLYDSWKFIVLIGFVGAMLSSFLYVAFLRIPCMLRAIVWTCLLGVLAVLVSGAYYFYKSYEDISSIFCRVDSTSALRRVAAASAD